MNWKKIAFIVFNLALGTYVVLAMTTFNKPDDSLVCKGVNISIEEETVSGFLTAQDVRHLLDADGISVQGQAMERVNLRAIEEALEKKELIEEAECYKGQDGLVYITIRQRIPVIRVMNDAGEDYCVDNHGKPLPHTDYACDLIVATGHISKAYAGKWLAPLANQIMATPFWNNQVVQLNVLDDGSVEMVPRVGAHIVHLGQPVDIDKKLERLRKFYLYGLNTAGWNRYWRISVEYDNQIVCKRKTKK